MKKLQFVFAFLMVVLISYHSEAQDKAEQITFAKTFVSNFQSYGMEIQAAGTATIPTVTLSEEGTLYIEYAYKAESESRNGKMTLSLDTQTNRFDGNWKTTADNGNVYEGSLYFIFNESGQADGFYQFSGADYKITIFKR